MKNQTNNKAVSESLIAAVVGTTAMKAFLFVSVISLSFVSTTVLVAMIGTTVVLM